MTSRLCVVAPLGAGGQAIVYVVEDVETKQRFAAKVLREETRPQDWARLEREAKAASRIDHPNVARVYGLERANDGRPFVLMELLEGRSLAALLSEGPLELERAAKIALDVAAAIAAAHAIGMIHRDVKPSNIFITTSIKVLDFGIAKIAGEPELTRLTETGVFIGTPEYMAPEQAGGAEPDPRSDIYALGVVLFEMVTGRLPFSGPAVQLIRDKLFRQPPNPKVYRADLPQALAAFILRAMSRAPEDRFESMERFIIKLRGVLVNAAPRTELQRAATPPAAPITRVLSPRPRARITSGFRPSPLLIGDNVLAFGVGPGWLLDRDAPAASFFLARVEQDVATVHGVHAAGKTEAARLPRRRRARAVSRDPRTTFSRTSPGRG